MKKFFAWIRIAREDFSVEDIITVILLQYTGEKVYNINKKLSERFGKHPAVLLWHISNEYGGECHCPLCREKFREWLKEKYGTIENLNSSWCTTFWSHTYNSFDQIESPSPKGKMLFMHLPWTGNVLLQTGLWIL